MSMSGTSTVNHVRFGAGTATCLSLGDVRKIHCTYATVETVEELGQDGVIRLRKMRSKTSLGAWNAWQYEIGEQENTFQRDKDLIAESTLNPIFLRLDSLTHFTYRVRNCPWPADNYIVEVDEATQNIVIKTKNKKYYKRFSIPDLSDLKPPIPLDASKLSYSHANNTLIIKYEKPAVIMSLEAQQRALFAKSDDVIRPKQSQQEKQDGGDCKQQ